jgi:putative zinc finger/helix-turn-helix YgiT family protein
MNSVLEKFCPVCGEDREFRRDLRQVAYTVRGESVSLDVPVFVCPSCGTEQVDSDVVADPVALAFETYRERHGLLSPENIKGIRKRYGLSQKSFATLLGMSEATINRYEGGSIQEATHDNAIRACEDSQYMADLLVRRGHLLPGTQRDHLAKVLDSPGETGRLSDAGERMRGRDVEESIVYGFRSFDYQRFAAVVIWLCSRMPAVTTTKLNKLLFYTDFLFYKHNAVSFTGATYRRLQYGPVPAEYSILRQKMEMDDLITVQEVQYQNGNSGEELTPGPCADVLSVKFAAEEARVLEFIVCQFKGATPKDISERSHLESAWLNTPEKGLISYKEAFSLSLSLPDQD